MSVTECSNHMLRAVDAHLDSEPRSPAPGMETGSDTVLAVGWSGRSEHFRRHACKHHRVAVRMSETPGGEVPWVRCLECGANWVEVSG